MCRDGFTLPYVCLHSQMERAVCTCARETESTGGGRGQRDIKRDPWFYKYNTALATLTVRVSHARNMRLCMLVSPYIG
jgi:hypothetical protein